MSFTAELVFRLPNKIDNFGLQQTGRVVTCECIRGDIAKEIGTLWEQYRMGCAGLNPAAYRQVVEALKPFTTLDITHRTGEINDRIVFAINDTVITLGNIRKAEHALALAEGDTK